MALFCNADETALLLTVFVASSAKIRFDEFAIAMKERIPELAGAELVIEGADQPPRTIAQWGETSLVYRAAGVDYRVDHGAFFQVNRWLVDALVEQVTAGYSGALAWDLFAGVGLFARRLAQNFRRVVAVESAPAATDALAANLMGTTGEAVCLSTLEFLHRNRGERPDLVVVDPPRTGLGAEIAALLAEIAAPALVYVSCDPATLARDLRVLLAQGYAIESITLAGSLPADISSRDSGPDAASLIGWKAIDPFQSSGVMESDSATPGPSAGAHVPPGAKTRPWSSLPLFHAAWLFALGIVAAKLIWLRPSVVLVALAMMAVLCAMAATRAQRVSWLALAPFWVLLGAWCAEMEPQPAPAPALGALSDGLLRTVEGIVLDAGPVRGQIEDDLDQASAAAPKQKPTQRLDLRVESIENVTDDQDVADCGRWRQCG